MAEEIDYDAMSDEDFMSAIENAGSEPVDDFEDTDRNEDTSDTELEESETNGSGDDHDQDTEFDEESEDESEGEENSQVDDDSSTDEDAVAGDDESEDDTETEDAENADEADEINYQEEYAKLMEQTNKLQGFYDEVTSEFVANGKKMKGFDDPKKIIQAQQMAAGFAEKMVAFKQYRPFMNTLKEKGFLDNPDKFNLAMQLIDGDPEAIKKQIKDLEIDPFELDMDNINYAPKNQVATDIELAFDDLLTSASQNGVDDEVRNVVGKDWDDQSVIELLEDPQSSADLVNHISSGAYDVVQQRIAEKKRIDVDGVFTSKPAIQQYREAANEVEIEYLTYLQNEQARNAGSYEGQQMQQDQQALFDEQAKAEYASKVEKKNAENNEARKRATSVSKKKKVVRSVKKDKMNPDNMSDDELTAYLDALMYT